MMKIILVIGMILVVSTVLLGLTGCTGSGAATGAPPSSSNIAPSTPTQTLGIPSQGGSLPVPASLVPPQGSISGGSTQAVPAPNMAAPSQGALAPNAAYPAFGNYYPYQPYYNQPQNTGIWVTGLGQVSVTPDVAILTLGVDSQASTVAEAQNNAQNAMNSVIQVLKTKGVVDKDITTVRFSINPVMNYKNNTVTAYQVSNMVTAKIRKINDTGTIIDSATSAGGNLIRINSVSFTVDDPNPFVKQARDKAMADASAKGSQLASLAGVKLGLPTFITEYTSNYAPVPIYYGAAASAPAPTTPINPGESQIAVTVQVVYAIQ